MSMTQLISRPAQVCAALLFVCVAVGATAFVHAQDAKPADNKPALEEPQYVGEFAALGPDGKLISLEKQKAMFQTKSKNHFISVSVAGVESVQNPSSPVRVPPTVHFVVRIPAGMEHTDPNTLMSMKPFVVVKDARTVPMNQAKAGMFQGVKSSSAADNSIALTFKPYGPNSLEIIPAQPLPPGEYGITAVNTGQMALSCFGVDAK